MLYFYYHCLFTSVYYNFFALLRWEQHYTHCNWLLLWHICLGMYQIFLERRVTWQLHVLFSSYLMTLAERMEFNCSGKITVTYTNFACDSFKSVVITYIAILQFCLTLLKLTLWEYPVWRVRTLNLILMYWNYIGLEKLIYKFVNLKNFPKLLTGDIQTCASCGSDYED